MVERSPFEDQQLAALSWDRGILGVPDEEMAQLAERMCAAIRAR